MSQNAIMRSASVARFALRHTILPQQNTIQALSPIPQTQAAPFTWWRDLGREGSISRLSLTDLNEPTEEDSDKSKEPQQSCKQSSESLRIHLSQQDVRDSFIHEVNKRPHTAQCWLHHRRSPLEQSGENIKTVGDKIKQVPSSSEQYYIRKTFAEAQINKGSNAAQTKLQSQQPTIEQTATPDKTECKMCQSQLSEVHNENRNEVREFSERCGKVQIKSTSHEEDQKTVSPVCNDIREAFLPQNKEESLLSQNLQQQSITTKVGTATSLEDHGVQQSVSNQGTHPDQPSKLSKHALLLCGIDPGKTKIATVSQKMSISQSSKEARVTNDAYYNYAQHLIQMRQSNKLKSGIKNISSSSIDGKPPKDNCSKDPPPREENMTPPASNEKVWKKTETKKLPLLKVNCEKPKDIKSGKQGKETCLHHTGQDKKESKHPCDAKVQCQSERKDPCGSEQKFTKPSQCDKKEVKDSRDTCKEVRKETKDPCATKKKDARPPRPHEKKESKDPCGSEQKYEKPPSRCEKKDAKDSRDPCKEEKKVTKDPCGSKKKEARPPSPCEKKESKDPCGSEKKDQKLPSHLQYKERKDDCRSQKKVKSDHQLGRKETKDSCDPRKKEVRPPSPCEKKESKDPCGSEKKSQMLPSHLQYKERKDDCRSQKKAKSDHQLGGKETKDPCAPRKKEVRPSSPCEKKESKDPCGSEKKDQKLPCHLQYKERKDDCRSQKKAKSDHQLGRKETKDSCAPRKKEVRPPSPCEKKKSEDPSVSKQKFIKPPSRCVKKEAKDSRDPCKEGKTSPQTEKKETKDPCAGEKPKSSERKVCSSVCVKESQTKTPSDFKEKVCERICDKSKTSPSGAPPTEKDLPCPVDQKSAESTTCLDKKTSPCSQEHPKTKPRSAPHAKASGSQERRRAKSASDACHPQQKAKKRKAEKQHSRQVCVEKSKSKQLEPSAKKQKMIPFPVAGRCPPPRPRTSDCRTVPPRMLKDGTTPPCQPPRKSHWRKLLWLTPLALLGALYAFFATDFGNKCHEDEESSKKPCKPAYGNQPKKPKSVPPSSEGTKFLASAPLVAPSECVTPRAERITTLVPPVCVNCGACPTCGGYRNQCDAVRASDDGDDASKDQNDTLSKPSKNKVYFGHFRTPGRSYFVCAHQNFSDNVSEDNSRFIEEIDCKNNIESDHHRSSNVVPKMNVDKVSGIYDSHPSNIIDLHAGLTASGIPGRKTFWTYKITSPIIELPGKRTVEDDISNGRRKNHGNFLIRDS